MFHSLVTEGSFVFTAVATDDQGATATSPPVRVTTFLQPPSGQVAIIRNFPHPEIDTLRFYLGRMNLEAHVLDQEGLSWETLQPFSLIIWDDLGGRADGLSRQELRLFRQAVAAGVPLYVMGDALLASAENLAGAERAQWLALLQLHPSAERMGEGVVRVADLSHPILDGRFGLVGSFVHAAASKVVAAATAEVTVLACAGSSDVMVAYEDPTLGTRVAAQAFQSFAGAEPDHFGQRRKLFQNTVAWLLRQGGGGGASETWVNVFATPWPPIVGSNLTYFIGVAKSGAELSSTEVTVSDLLGPGVEFVFASPGCSEPGGLVTCRLGRLANNGDSALVAIIVKPTLPGPITNVVQAGGNEYDPAPDNNRVTFSALSILPPLLSIERLPDARHELRLTGTAFLRYGLQASSNLADWSSVLLTNIPGPDRTGTVRFVDGAATNLDWRYYRAVVAP